MVFFKPRRKYFNFVIYFRLFEFRKIISRREKCYKLVPYDYPVDIIKEEQYPDCVILQGKFTTPFEFHLPGIVPKAAQQANFQVLLPKKWRHETHKPMCIHLAGTGDHVSNILICIALILIRVNFWFTFT